MPLGVVRHALLRPVIQRIFLQPRIEAGLLRALPAVCGTSFELTYLLAQIHVELVFAPQLRTHHRIRRICAGHSFGEPQRSRVLLLRVVHRVQRRRPDALHVPQMKKFMSGNVRQVRIGAQ